MVRFYCFLFSLLLISNFHNVVYANPDVVLNEVLANEPGGLTRLEWVELFNPDSVEVDLSGWSFVSKSDTTLLDNISIPAKGYLILARRLVSPPPDSVTFEARWGDASGLWGDSNEENFGAVEAKMSLTNTHGDIFLIDTQGNVSEFAWNKDWGDGISWEKIDPDQSDSIENWTKCLNFMGSTPGKINSVTPVPNDLCILSEDIIAFPESPEEFENFEIRVRVRNQGTHRSLLNQLILFCDYDFNSQSQPDEMLDEPYTIVPIEVDDYLDFSYELSFPEGNYRIYAEVQKDDKDYNNKAFIDLKIGEELSGLIINEFMCSPDLSGAEWVELFNTSDSAISLDNWFLGDSLEQNLIISEHIEISPGDYLVVTENLASFHLTYSEALCQVIQQEKWRTLNNTGDKIILKDDQKFAVDQVGYTKDWGKGISWERIDPGRISSDSDNWWRSVDPDGATPCEKNSLTGGYSSDLQLEIKPNPFSPDGDGFEDEVRFRYDIPLKSELSLKIYDIKGRLVKTLLNKEPRISGETIWDGKSDKQRTVRAGIYVVFMEAEVEGKKLTKKASVVVAKR